MFNFLAFNKQRSHTRSSRPSSERARGYNPTLLLTDNEEQFLPPMFYIHFFLHLSPFWNNNLGTQCKLLMGSQGRLKNSAKESNESLAGFGCCHHQASICPSRCNICRKCHRMETNYLECFLRQLKVITRLFPMCIYCSVDDLQKKWAPP